MRTSSSRLLILIALTITSVLLNVACGGGTSGTGTIPDTPQLSLSLGAVDFGNTAMGANQSRSVTVSNSGTAAVSISSITITGDFSQTNTCGTQLNASSNCTITVQFTPAAMGARQGTLTVTSNASGSPHQVSLTGTGVDAAAALTVSPTSIQFGTVSVGSSTSQNVMLTAGTAAVNITQANVSGAVFSVSGLAVPSTIAANQSTNFAVNFTPTATGAASGSVSIVSNASNSPTSISLSGTGASSQTSGGPVLFFSDLDWGPKTGWENSNTKGAAVTVWGKNFGSTRASSYVTINGAQLTTDASYAEWDAIGPARGLERITFWIPSTATDGAGAITVTVNGVTSNTLPFTVAAGTIYYVAPTGSNSNSGRTTTQPFRDLLKFNPAQNPSGDSQYIMYVRAGTYSTLDADEAFIALRGPYGSTTKRKALVGYPAENPVIDTTNASRGIAWIACYTPYGEVSYMTFAKMTGRHGATPFTTCGGSYNRFVGMTLQDYLDSAWAGVIQVTDSKHTSIYGNLFDHNGFDSYKHNIYVKTEYTGLPMNDYSTQYTDIGWNEFSNAVANDTHGGVIFISKSGDPQVVSAPTDYIYIHDSYFHDGQLDFIYEGDSVDIGSNIYIYNNIFKSGTSSNGGLTFYNGTNNVYLFNNVFFQMGAADQPLAWATGGAQLHFKNNIWVTQSNQQIFNLETFQGATADFDHDLFYNPSGASSAPSGGGITVSGAVLGDPMFVNPAASDFHLQTGSRAIDAGANTGPRVNQDYDGKPRPQGSAYDIGAFER